jgi:hypothetical protein
LLVLAHGHLCRDAPVVGAGVGAVPAVAGKEEKLPLPHLSGGDLRRRVAFRRAREWKSAICDGRVWPWTGPTLGWSRAPTLRWLHTLKRFHPPHTWYNPTRV